jgi:PAS domain S-box-containing protein
MKKNTKNFDSEMPLYNIRILRSYIDYVSSNYPSVDIDKILKYSGVTKFQYNDYGYWCNQKQMNRLQKILIEVTGNEDISRETGRNLINTQKIIALYILGFINPLNLTKQIERVYKKLSKASVIRVKYLGNNKHELISKPIDGVKEELYQCKNRIGSFEGLLKLFLHEYPQIEHPKCFHKGADCCKYIIKWKKLSASYKWLIFRNYFVFLGAFLSLLALFLLPFEYFLIVAFIAISTITFMSYYLQKKEKQKLKERIESLSEIAEDHWNELNISYRTTKLMQEVGRVTSVVQNSTDIASSVLNVMAQLLDYQRCIIFLKDINENRLFIAASRGFTNTELALINLSWGGLDPGCTGVLQKIFSRQEPVMLEDMDESSDYDRNDREISRQLNLQSMICVPVLHKGESLGVIAVDSEKSQREFREGDINLLMAVASQTGLGIANARSFEKLQDSEKKYRTLVETIQDIVYTVDLDNRFTYVSPMVENISGFAGKELLGLDFIEIVHSPHRGLVKEKFKNKRNAGDVATYEIEVCARDKTIVPVELNDAPLTDNEGKIIGRIGVARDVTARYLEEAKRKEIEVRALAQDKLATLGEIATGVAHEINQPLSFIKIILESSLHDMADNKMNREELSGDFNESLRQVNKITNIISHLRNYGRPDPASFGPVSLSKVFEDTLLLMNDRLRLKNITLLIDTAENLPVLSGNHARLEQVFVNLMQNSMDAMEVQGKGEISVTAQTAGNDVLITYSDTGEGMDPKVQERIFEPFFTTKEAGKGTGIGLSIVHSIIQEHKGSISCISEKGKGATFNIMLPFQAK